MTSRRKICGWGCEGQGLTESEAAAFRDRAATRFGIPLERHATAPQVGDFDLRAPRLAPPASLEGLFRSDPYERLLHAYGKSFPDAVRMFRREAPEPPDLVAYPETTDDVVRLLDWAGDAGAAVIPFGGGSSVVGGVEPAVGDSYAGAVTIDLLKLDRVLEVDRTSRAARIQAGARGPRIESQLREHGLTLRHFPQSFEHSTLGGWIATRSGGHFASLYTHIDDFVEATTTVTPRGVMETRRLPGSGAGPSPDRMVVGSEGILGVITEAWMRLQDRPTHRGSASIRFADYGQAVEAVRMLAQSGLHPSNCRLIDAQETAGAAAGDGSASLLVLGFESADHPVDAWMKRALELTADCGGDHGASTGRSHREGAAGAWRDAFIKGPYFREVGVPLGVIGDTFETAITWDRFTDFHARIMARTAEILEQATGRRGSVTCRFTHVYPDGPAPYFTFSALGDWERMSEQWREIKLAANEAVVDAGGTVTHHHAVGRDHRPGGYDRQRSDVFARALAGAKAAVDPDGLMNPGVLIDPRGRGVGVTGAMAPAGARSLRLRGEAT